MKRPNADIRKAAGEARVTACHLARMLGLSERELLNLLSDELPARDKAPIRRAIATYGRESA